MKEVIFVAKSVAAVIRETGADMKEEDGGALLGMAPHGDVIEQIRAPSHTQRSPVIICMKGHDFEALARAILREQPDLLWVGHWHLHLGMRDLSAGDCRELARLHESGRCPSHGLLMLLAIKGGVGNAIEIRGWRSTKESLEELDIHEVDDPRTARKAAANFIMAPPVPPHALGVRAGAARLASELAELNAEGVQVDGHQITRRGVELALTHAAHEGVLRCTIPAEGWDRPPKVELRCRGQSRIVLSPLGSLLSAWNSSFSLVELVTYARARGVWPRATKSSEVCLGDKETP